MFSEIDEKVSTVGFIGCFTKIGVSLFGPNSYYFEIYVTGSIFSQELWVLDNICFKQIHLVLVLTLNSFWGSISYVTVICVSKNIG